MKTQQEPLFQPPRIGYVAVTPVNGGFRSCLLVVAEDGDPVDFCVSDVVDLAWPLRTLLGRRMAGYLLTRCFLAPLFEASTHPPNIVCVEEPSVLLRRSVFDPPIVVYAPKNAEMRPGDWTDLGVNAGDGYAWWGPEHGQDRVVEMLSAAAKEMSPSSLAEPFERARAVLAEAESGLNR